LQRGTNLIRLVALLRRHRLQSIWILDRTIRPALAARLAGIPETLGLGSGRKALSSPMRASAKNISMITPIDWLRALMEAMNVPLSSTEPDLPLPATMLAAVEKKFAHLARPWIVLGIGASHPDKDWPDAAWCEFLGSLHTPCTVFLIGGPANVPRAEKFTAAAASTTINACNLPLIEAAALLRLADLFVGPSSGPLNLAAGGGTEAFGLFGSTPVLAYSRFIHAIVPEGGPCPGGMARIALADVLERIAPYLSRRRCSAVIPIDAKRHVRNAYSLIRAL
jgi:heptosyltransferase-2